MVRAAAVIAVVCLPAGCTEPYASEGERLAREHCGACHAFPEPELLDRETWRASILPRMAQRLGVDPLTIAPPPPADPHMTVLPASLPPRAWQQLVDFYTLNSPDTLPPQVLPAEPGADPAQFEARSFAPGVRTNGVITLLEADPAGDRVIAGEAGTNRLLVFDRDGTLVATRTLASPPTDVIFGDDHLLVLESGILHPNDEPRGRLATYGRAADGSLEPGAVLLDSLFRPVFVEPLDADGDGGTDFLVCEYGDNRGRLALYRWTGAGYAREVLDASPGAIRFEVRDLTRDGRPDVVALFAQGDERILLFENDAAGGFSRPGRVLARFPPVYGSMHFSMHDLDDDGDLDILYANGDNFDISRVRKPYHGVRILENDGRNRFEQRWFFPLYGAAGAEAVDFDEDGDLDILATSNFADRERHPERGIMFFENVGPYAFEPHAFSAAAGTQWNRIAIFDADRDGRPDALVGAMDLGSIAADQMGWVGDSAATEQDAILLLGNRTRR